MRFFSFFIFQTGFCKRLIYQLAPLVAIDWPEQFLTVGKLYKSLEVLSEDETEMLSLCDQDGFNQAT